MAYDATTYLGSWTQVSSSQPSYWTTVSPSLSVLGGIVAGQVEPTQPIRRAYSQGMSRPLGWTPVGKHPGYKTRRRKRRGRGAS